LSFFYNITKMSNNDPFVIIHLWLYLILVIHSTKFRFHFKLHNECKMHGSFNITISFSVCTIKQKFQHNYNLFVQCVLQQLQFVCSMCTAKCIHVLIITHKPRNGGCDMHVTIYTKPEMVIGTHVLMLRRVQEMVIWSDVYCYTQQRKW
jgi:hypothetical protein